MAGCGGGCGCLESLALMALIAGDSAPAASFGGQSGRGVRPLLHLYCVQSGSQHGAGSLPSECDEGQKGASCPPPSQDPSKGLGKFNGSHFTMDARRTNAMDRIRQRVLVSSDIMGLGRMRRRGLPTWWKQAGSTWPLSRG